ncbi:MAG: Gfo/Idh/MocA family oxidoreductase [Armatimonadetes bacterium]|nr:Gfo/Idh/MocA family oxidoreductase [Armatimonadota bacterium]
MGYTKRYGAGTVVYLANGHDARSLKHPFFQKLLVRSVDYAVGRRETGEVRCGIIGYGGAFNMGKLHGDSINSTHGMRVVAVCDLSTDRTEQAKVDFPEAEVFNRVEDLLRKPDLDLCVIITPHNTHAPVALKCLRAGKSVVSEKPFCLSVKEADAMIAAAKESKVALTVYHNRRYDGDYIALREILQSGIIGEVFKVEANFGGYGKPGTWWRSDKNISGGAFYDWGAHFVDWVLNLVPQPIESVSGYFFNKMHWHHVSNEDHCEAVVKFRNGTVATVQTSSLAAVGAPRWRILGTLGAVIDDRAVENHFTVVSHTSGEGVRMHVPYKSGRWDRYYPALADHLLRGEGLVVKPEEARRVIAVIEYAERSARSGKPEKIPGES